MPNGKDEIENVQLVFHVASTEKVRYAKYGGGPIDEDKIIQLKQLMESFKDFKVESIELSIEFGVQTGSILNLFVSAEGKGGCTVTLKPRD
jgi:hypothetical protein